MSKRTHITALGVPFDMAAFRSKNEKVRAVGNMGVNARGDLLDSNNNIIQNRNAVVNTMYDRTTQSTAKPQRAVPNAAKPRVVEAETTPDELQDLDDHIPNPKKA